MSAIGGGEENANGVPLMRLKGQIASGLVVCTLAEGVGGRQKRSTSWVKEAQNEAGNAGDAIIWRLKRDDVC